MVQERIAEEKKRLTRKTIYKLKVSLWKKHNTFHSVDDKLADLFSMENKSLFNQPEVSLYHVIKPMKCAVETSVAPAPQGGKFLTKPDWNAVGISYDNKNTKTQNISCVEHRKR